MSLKYPSIQHNFLIHMRSRATFELKGSRWDRNCGYLIYTANWVNISEHDSNFWRL